MARKQRSPGQEGIACRQLHTDVRGVTVPRAHSVESGATPLPKFREIGTLHLFDFGKAGFKKAPVSEAVFFPPNLSIIMVGAWSGGGGQRPDPSRSGTLKSLSPSL
jgi:hypothetical protein